MRPQVFLPNRRLMSPFWEFLSYILGDISAGCGHENKVPLRGKARQEQPHNYGPEDDPAMAGAEIPRLSAPSAAQCTSDVLRARQTPMQADTFRSQVSLSGSPPKMQIEFETMLAQTSVRQIFSDFVSSSAPNHISSEASLTAWNFPPKNNPERLSQHLLRGRIGPRIAPNHRGGIDIGSRQAGHDAPRGLATKAARAHSRFRLPVQRSLPISRGSIHEQARVADSRATSTVATDRPARSSSARILTGGLRRNVSAKHTSRVVPK